MHERLAWWHLCHSALSRTSFSSSSHSTLPVVLLSIPSLSLFLRLCCLFAPSYSPLTLWFDPFTLSQQAHLQTLSPVTSLFYSLYPILDLHPARFHPIISPVFFFNSKVAVHHTPQYPRRDACEGAHWRTERETGECAWGRWRTAVLAHSIGQVQVVILVFAVIFIQNSNKYLNMKYLICLY